MSALNTSLRKQNRFPTQGVVGAVASASLPCLPSPEGHCPATVFSSIRRHSVANPSVNLNDFKSRAAMSVYGVTAVPPSL